MSNSRLVYSTDGGDFRKPSAPPRRQVAAPPPNDGVVRVSREKGGRGGKEVTIIRGIPAAEQELRSIAADLKRACGVGGTVKDGVVEIQGDQRARVVPLLQERGYRVKLAGG